MNPRLSFEINRKIFHLLSLIVPCVYLFVTPLTMSILLLIIATLVLFIDLTRQYNPKIDKLVTVVFGKLLRPHEISGSFKLSGASYMFIGFALTASIFPKYIAISSWLILIISDSAAALFGMRFGKTLSNGKSFIGSLAFFVSALIISSAVQILFSGKIQFLALLTSVSLTTIAEFYAKTLSIDDNLLIPLTYCATFSICEATSMLLFI